MDSPPLLTIQLFARARDLAGCDSVTLPAGTSTVAELRRALVERFPALSELLRVSAIAVNQEFAADDLQLSPHDEIALIPPVSGG